MNDDLDERVSTLESVAAVREVKFQALFAIDEFFNNGRPLTPLDNLLSDEYRWESEGWTSLKSLSEYKEFLTTSGSSVSLSVQFLANGIVDIDGHSEYARANWVIWQPFTWNDEAWIMAGRSHDLFYSDDGRWKIASTRIGIEILAPWNVGWGRNPISHLPEPPSRHSPD